MSGRKIYWSLSDSSCLSDWLRRRFLSCLLLTITAGKPILTSLPLVIIATGYMQKASYMGVGEFMAEAPVMPVLLFMLVILGFVALAYYLAWWNVRKISLAEVLRDDTMM